MVAVAVMVVVGMVDVTTETVIIETGIVQIDGPAGVLLVHAVPVCLHACIISIYYAL
jgi:hypothetical protein